MADDKMMAQISGKGGFIAALDQSGGSTPGALRLYGIPDSAYSGDAEMFRLMHEMRVRIMTAPAFTGAKVIAAILFEGTMDGEAQGKPVPSLPVGGAGRRSLPQGRQGARGREGRRQPDEADAGARRRCSPGRRSSASSAPRCARSSTCPRKRASPPSWRSSSRWARRSPSTGSMPIIEPEVSIKSPDKAGAEAILLAELTRKLDALPAGRKVMLKLTIPDVPDFYAPLVEAPARGPGRRAFRRLYAGRRLQAPRRQSRHDRELLAGPGRRPQAFDERCRVRRGAWRDPSTRSTGPRPSKV